MRQRADLLPTLKLATRGSDRRQPQDAKHLQSAANRRRGTASWCCCFSWARARRRRLGLQVARRRTLRCLSSRGMLAAWRRRWRRRLGARARARRRRLSEMTRVNSTILLCFETTTIRFMRKSTNTGRRQCRNMQKRYALDCTHPCARDAARALSAPRPCSSAATHARASHGRQERWRGAA